MAVRSPIEWTHATWNPVTGCSRVSAGCAHCYAERMAKRLHAMGNPNYRNGFEVTLHEHMLEVPLSWKKPRLGKSGTSYHFSGRSRRRQKTVVREWTTKDKGLVHNAQ